MSNNNNQKLIKSLLKHDIIQEIIYTLIGCTLSFLVFLIIPKRWYFTAYLSYRSRDYPIMFISILFLIFVFLFILFNQSNSKTQLFKLNYIKIMLFYNLKVLPCPAVKELLYYFRKQHPLPDILT